MRYSWKWSAVLTDPYFDWIISGLELTLLLSLISWAIALVLGCLIGIARTAETKWIRSLAAAYVECFRNVPLLVIFFLWYFVAPEILPRNAGLWVKRDLPFPEFWTSVVALSTYTAAMVAEQVRAGIEAIPRGQANAALASGLTRWQVYRYILLPVGLRIAVPALGNEFINIFKNSSLALSIGLLELTSRTRQISEYTYQPLEMFITASAVYFVIAMLTTAIMMAIERRSRLPGMITRATR